MGASSTCCPKAGDTSAHKLVESGAITGIELDPALQELNCKACIYAHVTCLPISKPLISTPARNFGGEVHTDVWGPATITMWQGQRYFTTFTDSMTRFTIIYLLCIKDKALDAYKSYESWALTQQHCNRIKVLHSNHGGEYLSHIFNQHLAAARTACKLTMHDMPQHNSIAERLNRTLLERVHVLTYRSSLPKALWGKVLHHATWLKNHMATRILNGKMSYEALYGHAPDLSNLQLWGCTVLVHDANGLKLNACVCEA
jgi:transposase InsO family protein